MSEQKKPKYDSAGPAGGGGGFGAGPALALAAGGGGFGAGGGGGGGAFGGFGAGGGGGGGAFGGFGAPPPAADDADIIKEIRAFKLEVQQQVARELEHAVQKGARASAKISHSNELQKVAVLLSKISDRNVRRQIEADMMGKMKPLLIEEVPEVDLMSVGVGSDFNVAMLHPSSKKQLYRSKQCVSSHQVMMDTPLGDNPALCNKLKAIVCGVCLRFIMTTTGNMNPNQVDPVKHTSYILKVLNLLSKQPEIYELVQQDSQDGEPNPTLVSICEKKCEATHENETLINSIVTFFRSNFTVSAVVSAAGAATGMAVSSELYPTIYQVGFSLTTYITTGALMFFKFSYDYPLLVLAIVHSIALYHSDYLKMCRSTLESIIVQFGGVVPQPNPDQTIRGIFDRLLQVACPVDAAQYFHPDSYTGRVERYIMRLASTFCAGVSGSVELVRRNPFRLARTLVRGVITDVQSAASGIGDTGSLTVIEDEPDVMIIFLRKLQQLEESEEEGENKEIIKRLIRRISFQLKGLYADNVALHDALLILMNKMFPAAFPSKFDELPESAKAQRGPLSAGSQAVQKGVMAEEVLGDQSATEITELGIVELDTNVFGPFRDEAVAVVTEADLDAWLTEAVKDARSLPPGFPVVQEAKVVVDPLSLFFACFRPKQLSERSRPAQEILGKLQRLQDAAVSSLQSSDDVIDTTDNAIKLTGELAFGQESSGALSDQGCGRRIRIIMGRTTDGSLGGKSRRKSRKNTKRTRRHSKGRKSSKPSKKIQQRRSSRHRRSSRKGRK